MGTTASKAEEETTAQQAAGYQLLEDIPDNLLLQHNNITWQRTMIRQIMHQHKK